MGTSRDCFSKYGYRNGASIQTALMANAKRLEDTCNTCGVKQPCYEALLENAKAAEPVKMEQFFNTAAELQTKGLAAQAVDYYRTANGDYPPHVKQMNENYREGRKASLRHDPADTVERIS